MGKYLLEGIKPLADAVSLGISIDTILVREGSSFPLVKVTPEIVLELGAQLFDSIADTEHSQGVIAVIQKKQHDWDSFSNLLKNNTKNIVILDRLQDPGNMGTIIRTAEAAGYGGVLLMAGCTDAYAPKVVRAAAGSLLRMPILQENDIAETAGRLQALHRKQSLQPSAGMDIADIKIRIPMAGSIESLNAAVAAGILMYQSRIIK